MAPPWAVGPPRLTPYGWPAPPTPPEVRFAKGFSTPAVRTNDGDDENDDEYKHAADDDDDDEDGDDDDSGAVDSADGDVNFGDVNINTILLRFWRCWQLCCHDDREPYNSKDRKQ